MRVFPVAGRIGEYTGNLQLPGQGLMTRYAREQQIPADLAGQRLDTALARMFPEYSRTRLKDWISGGRVTVDGRQLRPRDAVAGGEQVVLEAEPETSVTSRPEPIANLAPVTAWTQRQLVFENQSLNEVAEEFNRYNRQHILIESAQLRTQLVTGVFQANDSASFLAFITRIPGVRITTTENGHHRVALEQSAEPN